MLRVSERQLDHERLPEGSGKRALLRGIERASRMVPLSVALQIARLSPSRIAEENAQLAPDPAAVRWIGFSSILLATYSSLG
jgi:hypothetical protein